jgi:hypothetical protein
MTPHEVFSNVSGKIMFRTVALALIVPLLAGSAYAQGARDVCDWHDLDKVHSTWRKPSMKWDALAPLTIMTWTGMA